MARMSSFVPIQPRGRLNMYMKYKSEKVGFEARTRAMPSSRSDEEREGLNSGSGSSGMGFASCSASHPEDDGCRLSIEDCSCFHIRRIWGDSDERRDSRVRGGRGGGCGRCSDVWGMPLRMRQLGEAVKGGR
jgi:hypothetical protein